MTTNHALDHANNVYLTVFTSASTLVASNPQSLTIHPSITHLGHVGELQDVQLLSVPRESWDAIQDNVLTALKGIPGVQRVDVEQPPKTRAKRTIDEL